MNNIIKKRFIQIQIILIILISSILIPSVNSSSTISSKLIKNYEKTDENINIILSEEDANYLLDRFIEIENSLQGIKKIKTQIEILENNKIISNDCANDYLQKLEIIDNSKCVKRRCKNVFIGPTIISHFIPRGSVIGTSFNKDWFLRNFTKNFDDKALNVVYGALPIFIGFCLKKVYITVLSRSCSGLDKRSYFPFFEVMMPCIGFSMRIIDENNRIFFEYNLDFCLFAILKGFR
jgi:hypothetical protein